MTDFLSVIVIVPKLQELGRKQLTGTLTSVLAQSYYRLELILVTDGQGEKENELCLELAGKDSRVKHFPIDHFGKQKARNTGLKHARGKYLTFVKEGSWLEKTAFEDMLYSMKKYNVKAVMAASKLHLGAIRKMVRLMKKDGILDKDQILALLYSGKNGKEAGLLWNKMFRRELFRQICFPEEKAYDDTWILCRLLLKTCRVAYVASPVYHFYDEKRKPDLQQLLEKLEGKEKERELVARNVPGLVKVLDRQQLRCARKLLPYVNEVFEGKEAEHARKGLYAFINKKRKNIVPVLWKSGPDCKKILNFSQR